MQDFTHIVTANLLEMYVVVITIIVFLCAHANGRQKGGRPGEMLGDDYVSFTIHKGENVSFTIHMGKFMYHLRYTRASVCIIYDTHALKCIDWDTPSPPF